MEDVAARSGFSRISVYREFGNRETLIRSLIVHRAEVFNTQLSKRLGKFPTLVEALDHYLLTSIKFAIDDPVTSATVRGPIDFAEPGSPHHDIVLRVLAPLLTAAKAKDELPQEFSLNDAVTWILITEFTLSRLVIDAKLSANRLRQLVRSFVLPAFARPR
jgi:AcrR family transcriptional regulator